MRKEQEEHANQYNKIKQRLKDGNFMYIDPTINSINNTNYQINLILSFFSISIKPHKGKAKQQNKRIIIVISG